MTAYRFSTDTTAMDRPLILEWLSTRAYWALGRTREVMDAAIDGSRNYGMFDPATGGQVAFARVITDGATFAWLCDVFVDESVRGLGVGVSFIEAICADLGPLDLKRIALVTGDAHGLYEKFGFTSPEQPEMWMVRMGQLSQPEPVTAP